MRTMRAMIVLSGLALLGALLPPAACPEAMKEGKPGPGDAAPLFTTEDLEGKKTSLEELVNSGHVVLLNFWGLRCSNCITEIGYLNPMFEKFGGEGAVFLGVNVDGVKAEVLKANIPKMPNIPRYTILPDPEFKIPDLYNLGGAPLSFVIGSDGKILYRHEDFKPGDEKEIEQFLVKAVAAKK